MALEIERKFLVSGAFPVDPHAKQLIQAYIAREGGRTVRVRYDGTRYRLTVKGPSSGIGRQEFEFDIDDTSGKALLFDICPKRIEKVRHRVPQGNLTWEVDVFSGANAGLIVAEIELPSADAAFDQPAWIGRQVSHEKRFFNAALLDAPFCDWGISYADLLAQAGGTSS